MENTPVAAGDTVYVGPGTYRELLTLGVSGTAGNPITYTGDYLGTNTDGVGGVVRITGSDNDQTVTRANCVTATTRTYRTFIGFVADTTSAAAMNFITGCTNIIIDQCIIQSAGGCTNFTGSAQATNTIQNCIVSSGFPANAMVFSNASVVDNSAQTIQNCIFIGCGNGIGITRIGGITVRNCSFMGGGSGAVKVVVALTVGQTITVNNCIFSCNNIVCTGTIAGEIVENYNTFYANATDRVNTNTGANSITYPPLFDTRWFFQLYLAGAGPNSPLQVLSPFDLASYSQLVNLAGTSPTTTDLRGTAVQGAQREWGALEADTTLKIFGGVKKSRLDAGH